MIEQGAQPHIHIAKRQGTDSTDVQPVEERSTCVAFGLLLACVSDGVWGLGGCYCWGWRFGVVGSGLGPLGLGLGSGSSSTDTSQPLLRYRLAACE